MHIRRYRVGDKDAVLRLHHAGLDKGGVDRGPGPWDDDLRDIEASYEKAGGIFLVGYASDRLVAMGALQPVAPGVGEVKRMRVAVDHRRQGLGQRILQRLIAFAVDSGYKKLVLDTTDRQYAAQRLYLKNGFVETRREAEANTINIFYELPVCSHQPGKACYAD